MPPPLDQSGKVDITKIRSYLGCLGFYRRFIKNLGDRARVLFELTRKDSPRIWTQECQQAFESLKKDLVSPPLLVGFRHWRPCVLHTDASDTACGAVLHQKT